MREQFRERAVQSVKTVKNYSLGKGERLSEAQ